MTSLRQRFIEDMQIRNLAVNTQESYIQQVSLFARHFKKSPELLGPEQIRAYQLYMTNEKKLSTGSIIVAISALRFLYCRADMAEVHRQIRFFPRRAARSALTCSLERFFGKRAWL